MVFSDQTYSVLVVSAARKFCDAIAPLLPYSEYYPVKYADNIAAAKRELLSRSYDLVLINAPLPDDFGTRFAIDTSGRADCAVLLFLRSEVFEEVNEKVQPYGVFTLQVPTPMQTLKQGLQWMTAARERLRRLEKKTVSMEEKMEEIRLVNRAKWILIEQLKMTEAEAHRFIEKQAMDRCTAKNEIALGIIKTYQ